MGFLANKRVLITGLLSNRSIAYGIAEAMKREVAELAFTYVNDKLKERATRLVMTLTGCPAGEALSRLKKTRWNVARAIR